MSTMNFASTKQIAALPTPFGELPLVWYTNDIGIFTFALIVIGFAVTVVAFFTSFQAWWKTVGFYLLVNIVFVFFPVGGAIGCRRDGCELAQAFGIAYTWYLPIFAVGICLLLVSLMLRIGFGIADIASAIKNRHKTAH